jgi:hypothetical protein
MVAITMWRNGARKCLMVISNDGLVVRLVDATHVIREEVVGPRCAASLAERWHDEDTQDIWHYATLTFA